MVPTSRVNSEFEVGVLGGGIAGLLIASELSKEHSVVLIEGKAHIPKTKYWLTDVSSAEENPHLGEAIDSTYESLDFIAYDATTFRCHGAYTLWNTGRLVDHLTKALQERGGVILTKHTFYGFKNDGHSILLFSNDCTHRVKLAVDCLGFGSPTIYAKGIVDIIGYYLLYGASYQATERCNPVGLHNLMLASQPSYIEAFPTQQGDLHLILILPVPTARKPAALRDAFHFIVRRSPYSRLLTDEAKPGGFLGGVIPPPPDRRGEAGGIPGGCHSRGKDSATGSR